ncbi:hypothetical protein BDV25DRAFT_133203 [Aspergillus avenaceus]|uniref:ATP-dependent protease n=1 Tax=Aspergillus avenaceus TaxID=36643 RepID=A0A5N6TIC5_ASPAV|nr:hypothetical protein BDV25DRAFT_133203 [Aspergillus avenaceus]
MLGRIMVKSPAPRKTHHPTVPLSNSFSGGTPPAHAVLRLIQCARCSLPLRAPLRLPCGNTLCQSCLPPIRERTGITYPATEPRRKGFTCHWGEVDSGCVGEHCLGDCGTDVLLSRLVDVFDELLSHRATNLNPVSDSKNGFRVTWKGSGDGEPENMPKTADVGPGLLEGMYELVKRGHFKYDASEVHYEPQGPLDQDEQLLNALQVALQNELDCQVCYSPILDPLTTSCGHTFCRGCVAMVLSNSDLCPACRRKLSMASTVKSEPTNRRISDIIEMMLPEQVASSKATAQGTFALKDEFELPLFVSSLSLPMIPTFLHVFEARYRLMMQRVMRRREHRFGMVMYNRAGRLQPELGRSPFMQYGTVVVVDRYELLPDGRSLVVATGLSRFKINSSYIRDGYYVGRVQRVDDISIMEEEAHEALETSAVASSISSAANPSGQPQLETMSTQQLFQLGQDFVRKQHSQGAPWLHPRVLLAYGDIPTDPAKFPWWFASVLPVWEEEKYSLLSTTSVRERLKITSYWVGKLESREWVSTQFTPFFMSFSVTFRANNRQGTRSEDSETYVPQTLVIGIFFAIFVAQVAANGVQIWRARRRRDVRSLIAACLASLPVIAALRPPGNEVPNTSRTKYEFLYLSKLKESLLTGGLSQETLDVRAFDCHYYLPAGHQNGTKTQVGNRYQPNGSLSPRREDTGHHHKMPGGYDEEDEDVLLASQDSDHEDDDRDDYENISRSSGSSAPPTTQRTILLRGLPDRVTHKDIVESIKGGALLHIYLRARERMASVSFIEEADAQAFMQHAKAYNVSVAGKRVEVLWNDRQFYLPPFVRAKVNNGASRNLVLHNVHPNITEWLIRKDLDHIHNLIVITVKFRHGNAYISTNSVHNALFARSCIMSRFAYKGTKITFYPDECGEPLVKVSVGKKEAPAPSRKSVSVPNRFQLLSLDGAEEEGSDHETGPIGINGFHQKPALSVQN